MTDGTWHMDHLGVMAGANLGTYSIHIIISLRSVLLPVTFCNQLSVCLNKSFWQPSSSTATGGIDMDRPKIYHKIRVMVPSIGFSKPISKSCSPRRLSSSSGSHSARSGLPVHRVSKRGDAISLGLLVALMWLIAVTLMLATFAGFCRHDLPRSVCAAAPKITRLFDLLGCF